MESSPPRVNPQVPPVAGVKRSASLLPAFEPSSSPPLPRPPKRRAHNVEDDISTYPTPVPTSSTAILTSSPPHVSSTMRSLKRTHSMSERAPLSAVPCAMLQENREPITMGRSSASCTYQLSSNRLISRVHVKAVFKPASHPFDRDKVEILCTGWNGIKLHCQGRTYELTKGKTFTSDIKDADIMIDVQDARVLVQWPRQERKDSASTVSGAVWDESSPVRNHQTGSRPSLQESPLKSKGRLASPVSPSPAVRPLGPAASPLTPTRSIPSAVVVYEDVSSPGRQDSTADPTSVSPHKQLASNPRNDNLLNSMSSSFSSSVDELSEHDEENDPIMMSFGPFGDNALPRMASFHAGGSPSRPPRVKLAANPPSAAIHTSPPAKKSLTNEKRDAIQNHIVNQLAFSRLSSTPFSTIISNLPAHLLGKGSANESTTSEIKSIIHDTQSIGKVGREGKDAAGKALETEHYYVPELDDDEKRKQAVVNDLRKPGLRACRKQHKQYFWRRPKTP